MSKVETYGLTQYDKGSLKNPDSLNKLIKKIKTFLNTFFNTNMRIKKIINNLKSLIQEYQVIEKLVNLVDPSITGLILWYTVTNFGNPITYIFLIILFEHYLPFTIEIIKRKY